VNRSTTSRRTARAILIGGTAAAAIALAGATPASAETQVDEPDSFTSAFTVMATPDEVIDPDGNPVDGQAGASGTFDLRINSDLDVICYDITLDGVTGEYESAAKTATHIHQAAAGEAGPPRIAFPNPSPVGEGPRTSSGCLQGPFTTGIEADGADTGEGFDLAAIEADPAAFAADSHTADFVAGVVRGQLTEVPVGGIRTGGGGAAASGTDPMVLVAGGAAGLALLGAGSVLVARRIRSNRA
jgi:hypothetical protein